eukprot:5962146-Karenia_brevis.AAC.1
MDMEAHRPAVGGNNEPLTDDAAYVGALWPMDSCVRLQNLSKVELNHQPGTVLSFDPAKGRYA